MRSILTNTVLCLLATIAMLAACDHGMKRQEQWDMVRAENRCNQGFEAYCHDLARMNQQ